MKFLTLIPLLTAAPAFADCPVAADLAGGIRVTETDGTINLFTAQGNGVVQNDGTAPDGYTYRNVLAQGTHLVELGDTENGQYVNDSRRIITYPMERTVMPLPTPNSRWDVATTVAAMGNDGYPEQQVQGWGAPATLTIGECTYDMIPGKVTYTNSDFVVFEGLHYLPALGLALLHSYQIQGDPADTYTAAKIEAVR